MIHKNNIYWTKRLEEKTKSENKTKFNSIQLSYMLIITSICYDCCLSKTFYISDMPFFFFFFKPWSILFYGLCKFSPNRKKMTKQKSQYTWNIL